MQESPETTAGPVRDPSPIVTVASDVMDFMFSNAMSLVPIARQFIPKLGFV